MKVNPAWKFVREKRYLALRTGVLAAAASVGPSFARGLLPRSSADQAMVTGASAAYWLGSASLGLSVVEALSELIVKARRRGKPENTALLAAGVVGAGSAAVIAAVPDTDDVPISLAIAQSLSRVALGGAVASALVIVSDKATEATVGRRGLPTNLAVAAAMGGGLSVMQVMTRDRRAQRYGQGVAATRPAYTLETKPAKVARSVGVGMAVAGGMVALTAIQFAVAEGSTKLVSKLMRRADDPVTPLVGHVVAASVLAAIAGQALNRVRRHLMHADDVVEPAYPDPPTSPHVTAGPNSIVGFDTIGKEGRRFVLMALTPEQITEVMGEPAVEPVRAVAGYETARSAEDRARIALEELERLGAFDRSVIVVAAPTGVGYVNYSFAEALEYLTRGDCAILVPQYALVPSFLALNLARNGVHQQELILAAIRDRIASMPEDKRPRLMQFGESLGAEVALDVAAIGTWRFDELGVERGLYFGTPFRSRLFERWLASRRLVDPEGILGEVSDAGEIADLPPQVRHVQVIHHDDPITKFGYTMVVRAPWWMGEPEDRPPGVPRETAFRPVITFIIGLIDLKNGMNSKPGEFVRRGHDYRIELGQAVQAVFKLPATKEQSDRIEQALRRREKDWATRRMVATRFAKARDMVKAQLDRWGEENGELDFDLASVAALARGEVLQGRNEAQG